MLTVIDDDRQLISGGAVLAADDKVIKATGDRAVDSVDKANFGPLYAGLRRRKRPLASAGGGVS